MGTSSEARLALKHYATLYVRNRAIQAALCVLIAISCIDYIIVSYMGRGCSDFGSGCGVLNTVELICCSFFIVDIIVTCFYYPSSLEYLTSCIGIVDVASVLPIFFVFSIEFWFLSLLLITAVVVVLLAILIEGLVECTLPPMNQVLGLFVILLLFSLSASLVLVHNDNALVSLQFLSVLRIFKAARVLRLSHTPGQGDEMQFELGMLCLKLIAIIFLATALVLESTVIQPNSFDNAKHSMQWHDAFYFTVVTMSTVGYGDYVPTAVFTKVGVVVFIFLVIALIPDEISSIQDASRLVQRNRRAFVPGRQVTGHVLLCGRPDVHTVQRFLAEFFHPDRAVENGFRVVVLLVPGENPEMQRLSKHPEFGNNVKYIDGCPSREFDLQLALCHKADMVYLLGDVNATAKVQDNYVLISALCVLKFSARHPDVSSPKDMPPVLAMAATAQGADSLRAIGVKIPLSAEELKATMLCFGLRFAGFIPFVVHLMRSDSSGIPSVGRGRNWLTEYIEGTKNHIYKISAKAIERKHRQQYLNSLARPHPSSPALCLDGLSWTELSLQAMAHSCVLLGMVLDQQNTVVINPGPATRLTRDVKELFIVARDEDSAILALSGCFINSKNTTKKQEQHKRHSPVDVKSVVLEEGNAEVTGDEQATNPVDVPTAPATVVSEESHRGEEETSRTTVLLLPEDISPVSAALFVCRWQSINCGKLVVVHPHGIFFSALEEAALTLVARRNQHTRHRQHSVHVSPSLEHVQGSSTDMATLERAGVCKAQAVICLSRHRRQKTDAKGNDSAVFDDEEVILTALALDMAFSQYDQRESLAASIYGQSPPTLSPVVYRDVFTLFEIQNQDSISFLRQNVNSSSCRYLRQHFHMSSSSYTSVFTWPAFAAGQVYAQSLLDALLVPLSTTSETALWLAFLDLCSVGFANEAIPGDFVGQPYHDLCCHFINAGAIVLGLYRPSGCFGASMPYVHTNPKGSTMLVQGDHCMVLKASGKPVEHETRTPRYCTWF